MDEPLSTSARKTIHTCEYQCFVNKVDLSHRRRPMSFVLSVLHEAYVTTVTRMLNAKGSEVGGGNVPQTSARV